MAANRRELTQISMQVSIVIATYNRADVLRVTLVGLESVFRDCDTSYELVVVDNNSTDQTALVCEEFSARLPLVYYFEPRQGKSNALNSAMDNPLYINDRASLESLVPWHEGQGTVCANLRMLSFLSLIII